MKKIWTPKDPRATAEKASGLSSKPSSAGSRGGLGLCQIAAALIGGTLIAFGLGLAVTLFVPGHDGLDEAFLGGLILAAAWPVATLWVLFAPDSRRAWLRGLVTATALIGASAAGLLL